MSRSFHTRLKRPGSSRTGSARIARQRLQQDLWQSPAPAYTGQQAPRIRRGQQPTDNSTPEQQTHLLHLLLAQDVA
jgi:hypothetical protein